MRVNVYSQEITDDIQAITKSGSDEHGHTVDFPAVRLFLHSSHLLHQTPQDDDRSAVTFWLPKNPVRRAEFAVTLRRMAELVEETLPDDDYSLFSPDE